jgi:UDP-2-acetamido-2-deoxy-ribo-hexuluronate aminotransferase
VHYPVPLHLQPVFQSLGLREGAFPVSERAARRVISLPMHPYLGDEQQRQVVAALRAAVLG